MHGEIPPPIDGEEAGPATKTMHIAKYKLCHNCQKHQTNQTLMTVSQNETERFWKHFWTRTECTVQCLLLFTTYVGNLNSNWTYMHP